MISVTRPSEPMRMNAFGAKAGGVSAAAAVVAPDRSPTRQPSSSPPPVAVSTTTKSRRDTVFMSGSLPGLLDRGADARVSPAATDIARHRPVDVGIARMGVLREQRRCRHNLTRLAVAALHDLEGQPRLLHLLAGRRLPDRLYGGNSLAGDCTHRRDARADRLSVEVHRACPAERHAATELRAGETDHITQHPEERHVRGHVHGVVLTVDAEGDHGRVLPSRLYVHCSRGYFMKSPTSCAIRGDHPKVNAKASTPASTNSISNSRSAIGGGWRIN